MGDNDEGHQRMLERRIEKLTGLLDVAKAMTAERNLDSLLQIIVGCATRVTGADRCTIWIVDDEANEIWTRVGTGLDTNTLRVPLGLGIAGQVARSGQCINIPDAYADPRFNPKVDRDTGYTTHNIIAVPMSATTGQITGVLQALNKGDGPFDGEDEEILAALGANAASAIENAILYQEIDRLFEGFVYASVVAIEARDPTTSGHSERVSSLTLALAELANRLDVGPFAQVALNADALRELRYAALLHDFGKVGVREHVLTKQKKLYPGEFESLETRFLALRGQQEADVLRRVLASAKASGHFPGAEEVQAAIDRECAGLEVLWRLVCDSNEPTVLEAGNFDRLRELSRVQYLRADGESQPLLTDTELRRLSIPRGTLDAEERLEIESHVTHTYRFLKLIPWTRGLRRVPDIAFAHHEKLDGAGYPRRLTAGEIPIQAKIMTVADIYDALTAGDRPYKKAVPHDKARDILEYEANLGRIDRDLVTLFFEADVPRQVMP